METLDLPVPLAVTPPPPPPRVSSGPVHSGSTEKDRATPTRVTKKLETSGGVVETETETSPIDENGVGGGLSEADEKKKLINRSVERIDTNGMEGVPAPVVEICLGELEVKISGKRDEEKTDGGGVVSVVVKENGTERSTRSAKKKNGGDVSTNAQAPETNRKSRSRDRLKERRSSGVPEENGSEEVDVEEQEQEEEEEEEEEEEMGEEQHHFSVGDLVWGKIKSHPWWPGQVYSSSDASTTAKKYKRRNRLLVAYFGDGTFAWCYPSQLKPFHDNFDQLAKQSNSKSFVKAVDEAVDEFGRRLDLDMLCSCVAVEHRPDKPVVLNAGIKEGVIVPDGGMGDLSIAEFEPAEFLRQLKYITQVGSTNDMLQLLVIQHRLSAFYRTKGYNYLPSYHEPMGILHPDDATQNRLTNRDIVEAHTADLNGSSVEADCLSPGPGVGSTSVTISRRGAGNSEDKLFQTTRQRSMAELLAGDTNVKDDSNIAEELAVSRKHTRVSRTLKEAKDTKVILDNGVNEEGNISGKTTVTPRAARKNKGLEGGINDDVTEEGTASNKTKFTPRKRRKNKGSEGGTSDDVAEENKIKDSGGENTTDMAEKLIIPGKRSITRKKIKESKGGNDNDVTEEGTPSNKTKFTPRKRRKNKGSEGGTSDDVAEENKIKDSGGENTTDMAEKLIISGKRSITRKKIKESKGGNDNDVMKEPTLSGELTVHSRGKKKKRDFEGGMDKDLAEELSPSANQTTKSRNRKRNMDSELRNDNVIGEEGASGRKRAASSKKLKKTKATGLYVTGENKESNVGNGEFDTSGKVEDGTTDGKQAFPSKMSKVNKPTDPSVSGENKASSIEVYNFGTNEGSNSSASLRERKKSKYLSPPYTNIGKRQKNAVSTNESRKEDTNLTTVSHEQESITRAVGKSIIKSAAKSLLVKCSGDAFQKELSKETHPESNTSGGSTSLKVSETYEKSVLEEHNASAHEMLSNFRSAALDPLNLAKKQSDDTMKGFFTKFRSSLCQNVSDFTSDNKYIAGRGSSKRVSFETQPDSPGRDKYEIGQPMSGGESERKKHKVDKMLQSPKLTSKQVAGTSNMQVNPEGQTKGEVSVAALLLTFAPGSSLPSKPEIIKTFSHFGDIKESETEIVEDCSCAQVVYARSSDAKEAYNNFEEVRGICSFGSSVVSHRLRISGNPRASPMKSAAAHSQVGEVPLQLVTQSLAMTTSVLERSWSKLSSEAKANLDGEIKNLLKKVTSLIESSSS